MGQFSAAVNKMLVAVSNYAKVVNIFLVKINTFFASVLKASFKRFMRIDIQVCIYHKAKIFSSEKGC